MKRFNSWYYLLIFCLFFGTFFSCNKNKERDKVDKSETLKIEKLAQEKWDRMLSTDLNEINTETYARDFVKAVSFHPQGQLKRIEEQGIGQRNDPSANGWH